MLWSIDSCQNRVSADQYHLTVSRAQVSTHRGRVSFWSYPLTSYLFSNDCRLKFNFFFKFIWNMLCLCAAQLKFWFQTDLGRENSASCYRQGRQLLLTFLTHGHALVTLYVQFLCSYWSKFDRWVHAQNLCSILNQEREVQRLLQSWFKTTCIVFITIFWLAIPALFRFTYVTELM